MKNRGLVQTILIVSAISAFVIYSMSRKTPALEIETEPVPVSNSVEKQIVKSDDIIEEVINGGDVVVGDVSFGYIPVMTTISDSYVD